MWSIPMDIAPKYSGTASGLMNTGSALAAIVSPLVAGFVIDVTGNWYLPFLMSMGLLLLGGFSRLPDAPGTPVHGGRGRLPAGQWWPRSRRAAGRGPPVMHGRRPLGEGTSRSNGAIRRPSKPRLDREGRR